MVAHPWKRRFVFPSLVSLFSHPSIYLGAAFGHGFAFEPSERSTPLTLPGSC
jgi:hypothetical protein